MAEEENGLQELSIAGLLRNILADDYWWSGEVWTVKLFGCAILYWWGTTGLCLNDSAGSCQVTAGKYLVRSCFFHDREIKGSILDYARSLVVANLCRQLQGENWFIELNKSETRLIKLDTKPNLRKRSLPKTCR
jgi:hypothetical protein